MRTLILALILASALHADWQSGPPLPSARDHLGCGMIGGMFVVAGGAYWKDGTKQYTNETIGYSNGKWIRLPFLPVAGAYGASAVIDGRLLIAGGANEKGALKTCFCLTQSKGKFNWKRLRDLPRPVFGAQGAAVGHKFYIIGGAPGMDEVGMMAAVSRMFAINLDSGNLLESYSIHGRVGAAVASIGDRLFVFGGYGYQNGVLGNFGDAWMYDGKWKRLKDIPIPARWTSALALDDHRIGLFGGYGEGFLDTVWIYDTQSDTYTPSDSLPMPVATMAAGIDEGIVYLAGGEDQMRHRTDALLIGRPFHE